MAGRASPPQQQPQQSIANDYIPLAFLLGSRAKHYTSNKATRSDNSFKRDGVSSSPPVSNSSSSSSKSALGTTSQQKKKKSVELFAPEKHLREREEEARRVLRQALLFQNAAAAKSSHSNNSGACMTSSSSAPSAATLSPMGVLKANKEQVLYQVLEMRQLEQEEPSGDAGDDDAEPNYRGRGGVYPSDDNVENENDARIKSFHGYQRADQQASFLDVSGRATHIPVLSNLKAKALHQSVLKKQSEWRATRVDEMHAFLQSQQQFTKQQLQLVSVSKDLKVPKQLARVDLSIDDYEDADDNPLVSHPKVPVGAIPSATSLAEVREQHHREQLLLHERVQEKKQLEQLTRQQKLAFHQQQKREFGRVKGVKRPSFLATLQLDSNSNAGNDETKVGGAGGSRVFGGASLVSAKGLLQQKKLVNQEENEFDHESENKLKQLQGTSSCRARAVCTLAAASNPNRRGLQLSLQ